MIGIWLIQLGTPSGTTPKDARAFIQEFLMDRRVIDIPRPLRWALVQLIVQMRASKIAKAYQSIWLTEGSPLRVYSQKLETALSLSLNGKAFVQLAMTYGHPNFGTTWKNFQKAGVNKLLIVPLFPQYASATTGTCLEKIFNLLEREANIPAIRILPPFFDQSFYIDSVVSIASETNLSKFEHFLFSFHGLPERQIHKSDPTDSHCLKDQSCCETPVVANRFCYRSHAVQTTARLAERLGIPRDRRTLSFQSRLGRTPWLKPYTDEVIVEIAKRGIKRLAVFSPSFVADCLETTEEIGIRGRELFETAGGQELKLIPSLNAHKIWVEKLSQHLEAQIGNF